MIVSPTCRFRQVRQCLGSCRQRVKWVQINKVTRVTMRKGPAKRGHFVFFSQACKH